MKSYLQEARYLVDSHPRWRIESLVNKFQKEMKCDEGTAIYFIEKAVEDDLVATYYDGNEYDGI